MTTYDWEPNEDFLVHSNIARFAARHDLDGYDRLAASWRERPEWFWEEVARDLRFEWHEPYERVLDLSDGVEFARWFTGGCVNLVWNCVDKHPGDRPAIVWEGEEGAVRTLTYAELRVAVDALARGLGALGIGRGDRVGVFLPLVPEAAAALYACAKLGAIAVPLFSGYGADAVAARLRAAGARVLLCADGFPRRGRTVPMKQVADAAVASVPTIEHVVVLERAAVDVPWTAGRDVHWSSVADVDALEPEWVPGEHPFLLAYTSGTTAAPKGAVHCHAGFPLKVASEVVYHLDYRSGDLLSWVTDPGWIMAPLTIVGIGVAGGTIMLYDGALDHPGPDRLWETAARHGVSTLGVSPTLVRVLMSQTGSPRADHDLSRLRVLGSTGEPWNPEPWRWLHREVGGMRCPIVNIAGGTECGSILGVLPIRPLVACAFNSPCVGVDAAVLAADGTEARGEIGELVVRAPWPGRTAGFWEDRDRFLETYWSTWPGIWRHGDRASVDDDGFWFLWGRSDDTLMVAGKRVGPAEIESVLVGSPDVVEAAAVGLPDAQKGEQIWCFCRLRERTEPADELAAALAALVASALGKPFTPHTVRFVAALPRTRNGKVMRRLVRAAATGDAYGDTSALENPESLDEIAAASRG